MTTTNEIADKIAAEQNLTKAQAKTIVESVLKEIIASGGLKAMQAPPEGDPSTDGDGFESMDDDGFEPMDDDE